ncbi:hypothetical protein M422DRAFT_268819 [Sphaerobolus stellatus SS14]|uniref:Uncharacterized protein n=1 Tax=Sphaerobolus stellatus (strain SS14) TaxID=990650 RepID=A0A0C9UWY6_SPHS4|nr:hypothetical protein M422DRAFT_268819 [Sphaerobolus stellatus SS14]
MQILPPSRLILFLYSNNHHPQPQFSSFYTIPPSYQNSIPDPTPNTSKHPTVEHGTLPNICTTANTKLPLPAQTTLIRHCRHTSPLATTMPTASQMNTNRQTTPPITPKTP